jgi:hypothetical protein
MTDDERFSLIVSQRRSLVRRPARQAHPRRRQHECPLDPIHIVGQTPAAMYFQRGEYFTSIDQTAARRECNFSHDHLAPDPCTRR